MKNLLTNQGKPGVPVVAVQERIPVHLQPAKRMLLLTQRNKEMAY
jgi:hypothetical protein